MDAVVIGSIATVVATVVVLVGFIGYWVSKIMKHPHTHD
jgi:preprotein translocase subunit Sss1